MQHQSSKVRGLPALKMQDFTLTQKTSTVGGKKYVII